MLLGRCTRPYAKRFFFFYSRVEPRTIVDGTAAYHRIMGGASPFHESDGDYRAEKFMEGGSQALPLYRLQDTLPRLPVPTLEETLARYLASVQPLAGPEEYQRTVATVREFLRPGGMVRFVHNVLCVSLCLFPCAAPVAGQQLRLCKRSECWTNRQISHHVDGGTTIETILNRHASDQ